MKRLIAITDPKNGYHKINEKSNKPPLFHICYYSNGIRCSHSSLVSAGLHLLLLQLLLALFLLLRLLLCPGEGLLLLNQRHLDVAGRRHVGVDPSVGPVGPPPHVRGTVDLDVLDDQVVGVQSLVLGVGLCVLQQVEKELAGLGRPAALGGAVNLGLSI